jgi:hypothetical protein
MLLITREIEFDNFLHWQDMKIGIYDLLVDPGDMDLTPAVGFVPDAGGSGALLLLAVGPFVVDQSALLKSFVRFLIACAEADVLWNELV